METYKAGEQAGARFGRSLLKNLPFIWQLIVNQWQCRNTIK